MAARRKQRHAVEEPSVVQTQTNDEITIDLGELLFRLLARWKMITCLALAFAIVFGVYTQFCITPMYRATSIIYVLNRKDTAISVAELNLGTALTADYQKVFTMWEVHEKVISNLDLPYTYGQMANMLSVTNDSQTRMLDISVTSANPEEAAKIANEYASVVSKYIEDTMSIERPSLMSMARVPANPVSPSKTRNVLMGFLLGAMLGIGFVTVQMLMDDKYRTAEDIRRYTGLVNLAVVPEEDDGKKPVKKNGKKGAKRA